jgi:hypothetical protein
VAVRGQHTHAPESPCQKIAVVDRYIASLVIDAADIFTTDSHIKKNTFGFDDIQRI